MKNSAAQRHLATTALSLLPLLVGCGAAKSQGTCAAVQGFHTESTSSVESEALTKYSAYGGYVTFIGRHPHYDGSRYNRCAAHVEFSLGDDGKYKSRIWTAKHCGAGFTELLGISVDVYQDGVYLENLPLLGDSISRSLAFQSILTRLEFYYEQYLPLLPDQAEFASPATSPYAVCASDAPVAGSQIACIETFELSRFEARVPSDISAEHEAAIKKMITRKEAEREKLLSSLDTTARDALLGWETKFHEAFDKRLELDAASAADYVFQCAQDWAANPTSSNTRTYCEYSADLEALTGMYVLPGGRNVFDEAAAAGIDVNTYSSSNKYRTIVEARYVQAQQDALAYWPTLKSMIAEKPEILHAHGNFSFVAATDSFSTDAPVGSQHFTHYLRLPFNYFLKSGEAISLDMSVDSQLKYTAAKADARVLFQSGDSGSLFSLHGLFPLAALARVDGNLTSGGAVLRPIPSANVGGGGGSPTTATSQVKFSDPKKWKESQERQEVENSKKPIDPNAPCAG